MNINLYSIYIENNLYIYGYTKKKQSIQTQRI